MDRALIALCFVGGFACSSKKDTPPTATTPPVAASDAGADASTPDASTPDASMPDATVRKLSVLYIDGAIVREPQIGKPLSSALIAEGIDVEVHGPDHLSPVAKNYEPYDVVVLSDVPYRLVTLGAQVALEAYVKGGGGLLIAGMAADYALSRLENLSPLRFDPEDTKPVGKTAIELATASAIVDGTDVEHAPALHGFVRTRARPTAELILTTATTHVPLLARWPVGSGTVTMWASDARSAEWVAWTGYGKFWAQLIRSTAAAR